jgi:hypothetical protein
MKPLPPAAGAILVPPAPSLLCRLNAALANSCLKLGVPVEPRPEILADVAGEEFEAGAQQLRRARAPGPLQRTRPAVLGEHALAAAEVGVLVSLQRVAADAGREDVLPGRLAALARGTTWSKVSSSEANCSPQ